ncbi:transposase [Lactococcus garvieae]|uniref:transposase n=1 Tax=Lactococcus garvieae TaxID=1363 RepID=UPI003852DD26
MTRNKYDQTFKKTLVDLYHTGKSVPELSKEYGVHTGTLYKWIDLYGKNESTDLSKAELKAMKSEIAKLKEKNEILKKAIVIFTNK